jgi:hypothetical protein
VDGGRRAPEKATTAHTHAKRLVQYLRAKHHVSLSYRALVFVDPHGKGEADTDYKSVYMAMMAEGLDVANPAGHEARINAKPRVEMVNRLFEDANGAPRCSSRATSASSRWRPSS